MHKVLTSEGIVLGKRGVGEANTLVAILSPGMGLVRASARSARREVSKLRYGLEPLTLARYSLVRGKSEWKLVGVEHVSRECAPPSAMGLTRAGKVSRLLLRLIQGEEHIPEIFATVTEGFRTLARVEDSEAEAVECVLVLRILAHLGYLPQTAELAPFINEDFFSLELSSLVKKSRNTLIRTINESLNATGL